MNLSIGLITCNEEKDIARTLNAVKDIADEIVIVDNGSTDKTEEIARSFHARFYTEDWKGFGPQKNSVIEKCKGKWILFIDADEEITPALRQAIRQIVTGKTSYEVFKVRFTTICFGKIIKHGGWNSFYRIRLFMNGSGKYDDRPVHENFITGKPVGTIKAPIQHYTYENLEEYFRKFNHYTSSLALRYRQTGKSKSIFGIYLSSTMHFFKMYFIKLGFLDGFEGYLLAKISAMYTLVKYAKWRELNKQ